MEKILGIWIITDAGVCLFGQSKELEIDKHLFSGFMSSIQLFIEEIGKKKLEKLELADSKLLFYNLFQYKLYIVLQSLKNVKDKYLKRKINEIQKKFIDKYGKYLFECQKKGLAYNLDDFEDFQKDLNEVLMENIDKTLTSWFKKL